MNYRYKGGIVCLLLIFVATVIGAHQIERAFPIGPLGFLLSMLVISWMGMYSDEPLLSHILIISVVASAHLFHIAQFGASMQGTDPSRFALWTQALMESGVTEAIGSAFYAAAPLFLVFAGMVGLITDLTANHSFLVYPIAVGAIIPTTVSIIVLHMWDHRDAALIAAIISVTGTSIVTYSSVQIAQLLSIFYWVLMLFLTIRLITQPSTRIIILWMLPLTASIYTHKISVAMVIMTMVVAYSIIFLFYKLNLRESYNNQMMASLLWMSLLTGLLLILQWEYITVYTDRAVGRILALRSSPVAAPDPTYPAATPLNSDLFSILSYSAHIVGILTVAGIAWVALLYYEYHRDDVVFLLTACALATALTITSVFLPLAINRMHLFAEPLIAIVIGVAMITKFGPRKSVVVVAVVSMVALQLFVAPATPDYPGTSRSYLTQSEVDAKTFGQDYATTVYTDRRYAWEPTPRTFEENVNTDVYQPYNESVLYGSIDGMDNGCIGYREGANNIHEVESGSFVLTWDINSRLNYERSKTYTTGDTTHYC